MGHSEEVQCLCGHITIYSNRDIMAIIRTIWTSYDVYTNHRNQRMVSTYCCSVTTITMHTVIPRLAIRSLGYVKR